MMMRNGHINIANKTWWHFYRPLGWAYIRTPVHKPLGMYFHLWDSENFNKYGDGFWVI